MVVEVLICVCLGGPIFQFLGDDLRSGMPEESGEWQQLNRGACELHSCLLPCRS